MITRIRLKNILNWIHWLSLDVVFGAVGGLAFAFYSTGNPFPIPVALILGVSVWIIYLSDHLVDSSRLKELKSAKYHIFSSHRSAFVYLILLLAALNSYLIIRYLPLKIIVAGSVLCFLVLLYLFLQQILAVRFRRYFPKELIISFFYITAIWFIPLAEATNPKFIFVDFHFLLTLINVLLFSYFERSEDLENQRGTCLSFLSASKLKMVITTICLLTLISSLIFIHSTIPFIVFVSISLVYFLELAYSNTPVVRNNFAEITDGAFMMFLLFVF